MITLLLLKILVSAGIFGGLKLIANRQNKKCKYPELHVTWEPYALSIGMLIILLLI